MKIGNKNRLGKKLSKKVKEGISKKIKELWGNPEYAENMRKKHLGQKAWNKGVSGIFKHSEKTKRKMSDARIGSKCHLWKGGITDKNRKLRECIDYRIWRHNVFERDKYKCQIPDCNNKDTYVEAHHIVRFIDNEDLRYMGKNGITLCRKCHNKTKGKEHEFEEFFKDIIKEKYGEE